MTKPDDIETPEAEEADSMEAAQTEAPETDAVADLDEAQADVPITLTRVVGFFLAGQRYALPIERVQEIQQIVAFSEVPSGGRGVVGMVNLRGSVIPAVDMRAILGLPDEEYSLETPMIICRVGEHIVAVVVDEVEDVIAIPAETLQEAPRMHALSSKMLGVARLSDGLVYVLDLDGLVGEMIGGAW
jgi:purine-binding chemotaxis protein CheW